MTPEMNLHILAERFSQLSRSVYFDPSFREFSERTAHAIAHILGNLNYYPEEIVRKFESHSWRVMQFVRGSRSSDAPHEVQYVLRKALKKWIPEDALISSAALEDKEFFLNPEDIWEFIEKALHRFDADAYRPLVVRIGAPSAYKHKPIFCIPLFHELGHFVDHHFQISETSLLRSPPNSCPPSIDERSWRLINLRHRMEYFADIFASCYCGSSCNKSLIAIAPNNKASPTHPATQKRVDHVSDFLSGRANIIVNILQDACETRTSKKLEPQFALPSLSEDFDDVRTFRISSEAELFGIFSAGWDYLQFQVQNREAPWIDSELTAFGIEKTVNDLVEKSIRNFEIRERWRYATTNSQAAS